MIARPWSLTPEEMAEADQIAKRRQSESVRRGLKDRSAHDGAGGGEFYNQIGARGECCFAKATGLRWWKGVNTPNDPDVGPFEVRTRSKHEYELIVRLDAKDRPYALVTGTGPMFIVWGWIHAKEMRKEWLAGYGDREQAYFVPHKFLRSINEIKVPLPIPHWSDAWLYDPEGRWAELQERHK